MRELDKPPEIVGDDKATEMIRVWLAHKTFHVSMLLGMWEDAEDCEVDERDAWGELLSDLVRHIANGLSQSHGWPEQDTQRRIARAFASHMQRTDLTVDGGYAG
jgi:hypothetical protein